MADASSQEVISRLADLERTLADLSGRIRTHMAAGQETFQFFHDALTAHRELVVKSLPSAHQPIMQLLETVRQDSTLRFPHRKILECLSRQFDDAKAEFSEVSSTRLWKISGVGKGRLKGYVDHLMQRGYIIERDDGYRKHYRIALLSQAALPAGAPS